MLTEYDKRWIKDIIDDKLEEMCSDIIYYITHMDYDNKNNEEED